MTISCLAEQFTRVESNRPLWTTPSDQTLTAQDIGDLPLFDVEPFRGRNVSVELESSFDLARSLLMLDGVCRSMLLLPPGLDSTQRHRLQEKAGTELTLV